VTGYNPKFDQDLEKGEFAEGKLARILREAGRYVEIKSDGGADKNGLRTGNIFVEFQCRGVPSGIATTESYWWAVELEAAFGGDLWLIMPTRRLRDIATERWQYRKAMGWQPFVNGGDDDASRGVLLPCWSLVPRKEKVG
jgi:hypothetical protein